MHDPCLYFNSRCSLKREKSMYLPLKPKADCKGPIHDDIASRSASQRTHKKTNVSLLTRPQREHPLYLSFYGAGPLLSWGGKIASSGWVHVGLLTCQFRRLRDRCSKTRGKRSHGSLPGCFLRLVVGVVHFSDWRRPLLPLCPIRSSNQRYNSRSKEKRVSACCVLPSATA